MFSPVSIEHKRSSSWSHRRGKLRIRLHSPTVVKFITRVRSINVWRGFFRHNLKEISNHCEGLFINPMIGSTSDNNKNDYDGMEGNETTKPSTINSSRERAVNKKCHAIMQSFRLMFGRGMKFIYGHCPLKTERETFSILLHVLDSDSGLGKVHLKSQNRFTFIYANNLDFHVFWPAAN